VPILQSLRAWVDKTRPRVVKESLLGKAVHYLNNQWDRLIRYTEHGCIPIDNNPVEQIIRPFVIGRNAWLFSDTPSGAKASAVLYTLVQTAKLNGLEPYRYLRKILADLPNIDPEQTQKLDKLLPWNVDKKDLTIPDY
jgi:transposase